MHALRMTGNKASRWRAVSCLESLTLRRFETFARLRMIAPATTGPAHAPRPASSMPAINEYPARIKRRSCLRCGNDVRCTSKVRRTLRLLIILPAPAVAPHFEDFPDHLDRIADRTDLRLWLVIPRDRHFDQFVFALQRDEQHFHIKAPAI